MAKWLVWIGVLALGWLVWRMWTISQRRIERSRSRVPVDTSPPASPSGGAVPEESLRPERMVQCAVCGVHLPGSEARFAGGRVYCSDAHRDQGPHTPSGGASEA